MINQGMQNISGIGTRPVKAIKASSIGKVAPVSREGPLAPIPDLILGAPPALQGRHKSDVYSSGMHSRENYVRQNA